VLIAQIDGLDQNDLVRWIANEWVKPDVEDGRYVFHAIDIARVHLIYELREDLDVNESTLPIVLSLLDQLYDLRRHLRTIDNAIDEIVTGEMKQALAERIGIAFRIER
jgi:chaperone modulatory protein CbpM